MRRFSRGDGDQERYLADLSRPAAPAASLNWHRASLAPQMPGTVPELLPAAVPTLGIWSADDHYIDGGRMEKSGVCVNAPWRYEVIEGASRWIPGRPRPAHALVLD